MTDPADDGVLRVGERPLRRVAVRQTAGKIGHHSEIPAAIRPRQRAMENGVIRWRWQTHNAAPAEYPGWAAMAWILTPGQVAIGMDGARAFLAGLDRIMPEGPDRAGGQLPGWPPNGLRGYDNITTHRLFQSGYPFPPDCK